MTEDCRALHQVPAGLGPYSIRDNRSLFAAHGEVAYEGASTPNTVILIDAVVKYVCMVQ